MEWLQSVGDYFYNLLIYQDRYMTILKGLGNTLVIAAAAAVIGISLGMLVAMIKYFCKDKKALRPLEWICNMYVTAIRGTPVMVQLFIWSLVILASWKNALPIACIGFGFNSGAYVAEIIRAGIAAVDPGRRRQAVLSGCLRALRCVISSCRRQSKTFCRRWK